MVLMFYPTLCNLTPKLENKIYTDKIMQEHWPCVIYGVVSWSGVLKWSHTVEFLSGFWSGTESDFMFLSSFMDRIYD